MLYWIYLFVFIGKISASFNGEQEFEVKQGGLLNNGRSYTIEEIKKPSTTSDSKHYTIKNDLFSIGKKLVLLENGKPIYELKHKLGHLFEKWNVYDPTTGDTVATLKHRPSLIFDSYKVKSAKFGNFRISGNFGNRTFKVKKDGHQVAEIYKKPFHLHDTYSVKIETNQDPSIILLIAIGIDEIRHH